MKYSTTTGEIEGEPEEIARFLSLKDTQFVIVEEPEKEARKRKKVAADKRFQKWTGAEDASLLQMIREGKPEKEILGTLGRSRRAVYERMRRANILPKVQETRGKGILKRKVKFTPAVLAYLTKAYPTDHPETILKTLKDDFGLSTSWGSLKSTMFKKGVKRNRSVVMHQAYEYKGKYMAVQKICKKCSVTFKRPDYITNAQWASRIYCPDCYTKKFAAMRSVRDTRKAFPDAFPRFSTTLADAEILEDLFRDIIANKKSIGRESWHKLQIRNTEDWLRFAKEAMKLGELISGYFASKNLFTLKKTSDEEMVKISYG